MAVSQSNEVYHKTYILASPEELYRRLTSGVGWERWFASRAEVGENVGQAIYFRWDDFGPDHYTAEDHGRVLQLEKNRLFSFSWHPGDFETAVIFEFQPHHEGCFLSVLEKGYRFVSNDMKLALQVAAGWGEALTLFKFFVEHDLVYGRVPS